MTPVDWTRIKHFVPDEFDSPDKPGSGRMGMERGIVTALDYIREQCGFPLIVNSGFRTQAHNAQVGGVDGSAHMRGWAADIACRTSQQRYKILYYAHEIDIHRMGIGPTIIHLDLDPGLSPNVIWLY